MGNRVALLQRRYQVVCQLDGIFAAKPQVFLIRCLDFPVIPLDNIGSRTVKRGITALFVNIVLICEAFLVRSVLVFSVPCHVKASCRDLRIVKKYLVFFNDALDINPLRQECVRLFTRIEDVCGQGLWCNGDFTRTDCKRHIRAELPPILRQRRICYRRAFVLRRRCRICPHP